VVGERLLRPRLERRGKTSVLALRSGFAPTVRSQAALVRDFLARDASIHLEIETRPMLHRNLREGDAGEDSKGRAS